MSALETKRLILRPLTLDDFPVVHALRSNPANARFVGWEPGNLEQSRTYIKPAAGVGRFAVVDKKTGALIGCCSIKIDERDNSGSLGAILHEDHQDQGYGTEICAELLRHGFEDIKLRRITADCAAPNAGSIRVLEKNKMRREALHIKSFWSRVDKVWMDDTVYAMLAEEYS